MVWVRGELVYNSDPGTNPVLQKNFVYHEAQEDHEGINALFRVANSIIVDNCNIRNGSS